MNIPVVFLVFNRPELTQRVFARIRAARPPKLFVVADGPRVDRPGDAEKCAEVRRLIETGVDWPCEVVRDYSGTNLGCGRRVASGITNALAQVEEVIVLEDDCLPDPTFFRFCEELLTRYRDEPRVGLISGSHHQAEASYGTEDYYFCRYGNIWGWATWRRAWQKFDLGMAGWPEWKRSGRLETLFPDRAVRAYWRQIWDETHAGRHDTWDYQWTFCYLSHGLLGILPRVALIQNIGFGVEATHTTAASVDIGAAQTMTFPLRHPAAVEPDREAERRASCRFFSRPTFAQRLKAKVRRLLGR